VHADGFVKDARAVSSPDGERIVYSVNGGQLKMATLAGGEKRIIPGPPLGKGGYLAQWSADGRFLYLVRKRFELPIRVDRLEIATGRMELWKLLNLEDPAGARWINPVRIAPDGQSYAYSYTRILVSDLYLVEGVR
jgi:Tol biopolymer transport system component